MTADQCARPQRGAPQVSTLQSSARAPASQEPSRESEPPEGGRESAAIAADHPRRAYGPRRALDQKDPVATPSSLGVVGRISHSDRLIVELVNTGSTPVVILIRPQLSTARKRVGASFLITRPPLRRLTGLS